MNENEELTSADMLWFGKIVSVPVVAIGLFIYFLWSVLK